MPILIKHCRIRVFGLVQGVLFRESARRTANELNIKGLARNQADGSVYLEAEGEEESLKKFIQWCERGPVRAQVQKIEVGAGQLKNYQNFLVFD